ncbi:hypothetical protein [Vibrio nigripulchritudo]|uniref:hypothetical protein n=1 Tax=Vibrio nigripulchritudo TaxID=28173 RepID=UPI002491A237|nr:hypothetical protein [Vibrio nigripulchritudo]BDU46905.1 hypothetical protein TUMSATVNIG3_57030 [Vibrio nigripulchritudo]
MGPGRNDAVRTEIIPVRSGSDPLTRDPEVKSLLDYMGIGANRDHFSANFNILKMTVVDATRLGTGGVDFFMPDQHVKLSPAMTYMHYFKTVGSVNVNLGGTQTERGPVIPTIPIRTTRVSIGMSTSCLAVLLMAMSSISRCQLFARVTSLIRQSSGSSTTQITA